MENDNLDSSPTDQELNDAGFKRQPHDIDGYEYSYSRKIIDELILSIRISTAIQEK